MHFGVNSVIRNWRVLTKIRAATIPDSRSWNFGKSFMLIMNFFLIFKMKSQRTNKKGLWNHQVPANLNDNVRNVFLRSECTERWEMYFSWCYSHFLFITSDWSYTTAMRTDRHRIWENSLRSRYDQCQKQCIKRNQLTPL